ncbi:MAG TPA: hypothetical protein VFJ58_09655 [Armatimonadota bacterium]|nr:hypothetical protein [Armatimonadota bacterium]
MLRHIQNQSATESYAGEHQVPPTSTERAHAHGASDSHAYEIERLLDFAERLQDRCEEQEWGLQLYRCLFFLVGGIAFVIGAWTGLVIATPSPSHLAISRVWDPFLCLVLSIFELYLLVRILRHWREMKARVVRDRRALNEVLIILQEIGAEVRAEYSALEYAAFRIRASRLDIGSERAPSAH